MGLSQVPEKMPAYGILTNDEKARMYPCTRAKCVMRSGDSPPPLQASIPSTYDVPDDAGITGKVISSSSPAITASIKPLRPDAGDSDAEVIEEAVPIVHKTLPTPEPQPKLESNGFDRKYTDENKLVDDFDEDPCTVKCVRFTQQCCECAIM